MGACDHSDEEPVDVRSGDWKIECVQPPFHDGWQAGRARLRTGDRGLPRLAVWKAACATCPPAIDAKMRRRSILSTASIFDHASRARDRQRSRYERHEEAHHRCDTQNRKSDTGT